MKKNRIPEFLLVSVFLSFYVIGMLFPEVWWGTHFLAFLSLPLRIFFLLAGAGLLIGFGFTKKLPSFRIPTFKGDQWLIPLGIAMLIALLCFFSPIHYDFYGDAEKIARNLDDSPFTLSEHIGLLLDPNVTNPKIGAQTGINLGYLIREVLGVSTQTGFGIMGAVSCFVFVLCGLIFVRRMVPNEKWRLGGASLVVGASFLWLFCGHIEAYALGLLFNFLYMGTLLLYFKERKTGYLIAMAPLLFLAMKSHSAAVLLLPSFGLTLLYHFFQQKSWTRWLFSGKGLLLAVVLPILAVGAYVYFGVLEDHTDPRFLDSEISVFERMFLPIVTPEPPFERYNLLSLNHIFDYFNQLLLWSAGGLFLILSLAIGFRKEINWKEPGLLISGLTLFLFALFFFMVNPLLSMPIDVDLFSLPGPLLIAFAISATSGVKKGEMPKLILAGLLVLSLFSFSHILMNSSPKSLSNRANSLSVHIFKTYWSHSAEVSEAGFEMIALDEQSYIERSVELVDRTEKWATPVSDAIFWKFLRQVADYYREKGDFEAACPYYEKCEIYFTGAARHYIGLIECDFMAGRYQDAYRHSAHLVEYDFPTRKQALRMAIHTALEASLYKEAQMHADAYLQEWPEDQQILFIEENLRKGTNLPELKNSFRQNH